MSTAKAPISPPEEDLKTAIISLKERHPTLGITKYHTLLLSENPEWIVKYFDKKKEKGLVAREPISEGQLVWKEDPFIIAPEWSSLIVILARPKLLFGLGRVRRALLQPPVPQANPASVPLLSFARKNAWMALHALSQCTARLLLAYQKQQGRQQADGGDEEWHVYSALADLGMEEGAKGSWLHGAEPDRATWQVWVP
ncbi:hypothetical protein BC827DRAFT_1157234 [Russula dissimulans]|nr:hypothetical protein BC827DRAFT_1157234 [Russula dissimulans]